VWAGLRGSGVGGLADSGASDGELQTYSLVELAVERLRTEILSGRTDPGQRLIEEQLTRRLGISSEPLGSGITGEPVS